MQRVKHLHQALMDAFTPDDLDRLLRFNFENKRLFNFTNENKSKDDMFLDVIDASIAGGWMLALAEAAFRERSGNEKLRAFFENHVERNFRSDHAPRRQSVEKQPYYMPESGDINERVRMLEILWRGVDGYNGALSKIRHLERLFWALVALRLIEMAYVVVMWR